MTSARSLLLQAQDKYRRIYYRPVYGNAGDALIAAGFYQLADEIGLDFRELSDAPLELPDLTEDDLVILAGGGWFTSHWDFGTEIIERLTQGEAALLILPQSVYDADAALACLRERDTLLVRERYSLEYVTSARPACGVHLDHDLAIGLDPDWLFAHAPRLHRPADKDQAFSYVALARLRAQAWRTPTLEAWRTDAEASGHRPGARYRDDLSLVCYFGVLDRASALYSAAWLLRAIRWFEAVETDRLHVGIGAALLQRPVRMHANNYHKIRGIFEYSITSDPRLAPWVTFVGADGQVPASPSAPDLDLSASAAPATPASTRRGSARGRRTGRPDRSRQARR